MSAQHVIEVKHPVLIRSGDRVSADLEYLSGKTMRYEGFVEQGHQGHLVIVDKKRELAPAILMPDRTPIDTVTIVSATRIVELPNGVVPPDEGDERLLLEEVFATYLDGDERGWEAEFAHLRTEHAKDIATLTVLLAAEGQKEPVLLGADGRVWDGHHRLCVMDALSWPTVKVTHAR